MSGGSIVAWGTTNGRGQCDVPSPNAGFVAVAAGGLHGLGLQSDSTVIAWGWNLYAQCDVPAPNSDFVAISAGQTHSLGLKADGSISAWGYNQFGKCEVPAPNSGFVAVAAGAHHSLGLKADGSIVAWGYNIDAQCDVPSPNSDFAAVAAGNYHSLGMKADGSIVAWGSNEFGQCNAPPPDYRFVAVSAGCNHNLGLKADGSILAWGRCFLGECDVPYPNTDFTAVSAGANHSLGLKADGSIVGWGYNRHEQCDVPSPNSGFAAVAAGDGYSLAIRDPATAVAFGDLAARAEPGFVVLHCALVLDHPGQLQVLRAQANQRDYEPASEVMTVAVGKSAFSWRDTSVQPSTEYFYQIACLEAAVLVYSQPVRVLTPGGALRLRDLGPNPSRSGLRRLEFALVRPGRAQLEIFDVAGRRVRLVAAGRFAAGVSAVDWDGCREDGRLVAPGVYWVRLQVEGQTTATRITIGH